MCASQAEFVCFIISSGQLICPPPVTPLEWREKFTNSHIGMLHCVYVRERKRERRCVCFCGHATYLCSYNYICYKMLINFFLVTFLFWSMLCCVFLHWHVLYNFVYINQCCVLCLCEGACISVRKYIFACVENRPWQGDKRGKIMSSARGQELYLAGGGGIEL